MHTRLFSGLAALILTIGVLASGANSSWAGEVNNRLDRLARKLTDSYKQGKKEADKAVLAVLRFQALESLERRQVGFALTELLTQRFVARDDFKVVERANIKKVLTEQKLSLSGAVDTETAVSVGQLLGARLVVVGSVTKVGNLYQVHGRIVDVESGEILGADYQEISAALFDEEAKPYLTLVPDTQAIGLYFRFGYAPAAMTDPGATIKGIAETTPYHIELSGGGRREEYGLNVGLGVRYQPWPRIMLDLSFLFSSTGFSSEMSFVGKGANAPANIPNNGFEIESKVIEFSVLYLKTLGSKLRLMVGPGVQAVIMRVTEKFPGSASKFSGAPPLFFSFSGPSTKEGATGSSSQQDKKDFGRLLAKMGVEWKPQQRIGIAFLGTLMPFKENRNLYIHATGGSGDTTYVEASERLTTLTFPTVSADLSFAFYF